MTAYLHASFRFTFRSLFSVLYALLISALIFPTEFTGSRVSAAPAAPQAEASSTSSEPTQEEMTDVFDAMRQLLSVLPRDGFDPDALVQELGKDPDVLCNWVQKQISWVPYEGHLRNPSAVLMDQTGNSLDQAVLLYQLLKRAGHRPVLASAAVEADWVQKQLLEPVLASGQLRKDIRPGNLEVPEGLEDPEVVAKVNDVITLRNRHLEGIATRASRQMSVLHSWFESSSEKRAPKQLPTRHWWVELENLQLQLDPSGAPKLEAEQRCAYSELPSSAHHSIEFTLQVERLEGGKLVEESALQTQKTMATLGNKPILLAIQPTELPVDYKSLGMGSARAEMNKHLLETKQWTPYFDIAGELIRQNSFSVDGTLNQDHTSTASGKAMNQASGLLGGMDQNEPAVNNSTLTRVRLVTKTLRPGSPPDEESRTLYNALSYDDRLQIEQGLLKEKALNAEEEEERSLSISCVVDMFVQSSMLTRNFVTARALERALTNQNPLQGALLYGDPADAEKKGKAISKIERTSQELYDFALTRFLLNPDQKRIYLDQANLIGFHGSLRKNEQEELLLVRGYDLLSVPIAMLPHKGVHVSPQFKQHVLDNITESVLPSNPGMDSFSASGELERISAEGWIPLQKSAELERIKDELDPLYYQHLAEQLQQGFHLRIPPDYAERSAEQSLWWAFHPETAQITGYVGRSGWGGSIAEKAALIFFVALAVFVLYMTGGGACLEQPTLWCLFCGAVAMILIMVGLFLDPTKALATVTLHYVTTQFAGTLCAIG